MTANLQSNAESTSHRPQTSIGIVVIGRNEGERLRGCLESLGDLRDRTTYVDSGSRDTSVALSRSLGVEVVELDMSIPFTAARARNAGFERLLEMHPGLDYVFFVDGDCEILPGWIESARGFLDQHPDVAVVWGQRRERFADRSIYNMLCAIEWVDYPLGSTKVCGGDSVSRVQAFRQVHGYRPDLICGEEPEMCVRLRQAGWKIWHLDVNMTLHDAAIYHFSQWWRRSMRGGYGAAIGASLHGAPPERHSVRATQRAWLWGFWLPTATIVLGIVFGPWALVVLAAYPLQVIRLWLMGRRSPRENWWRAVSLVVGKFPEVLGQMKFGLDRLRGTKSRLIEYK
jgi:glycosyltransferase involved in cell wall biosynthesis